MIGGDAERYRWFVRRRTAPDADNEPRVRDLDVPRRAAAVASAQNATSEDRFLKSSRSFDVGHGEKQCDGKPILRRHLIAFLLDLYLVHRRLQFGHGVSPFARIRWAVCFSNELRLTAKTQNPPSKKKYCGHSPGRSVLPIRIASLVLQPIFQEQRRGVPAVGKLTQPGMGAHDRSARRCGCPAPTSSER